MLGLRRTIGWIDDIVIFQRLLSLSLSDNGLEEFPLALCNLANIQELDISCNRIKIIPQEIKHLTKLVKEGSPNQFSLILSLSLSLCLSHNYLAGKV